MKKVSRLLSLALVLVLSFTLLCTVGSASESVLPASKTLKEKYNQGTGYVAIGDSITRGYAASANWDIEGYLMDGVPQDQQYVGNTPDIPDQAAREALKRSVFCRNVTDSYPKQIADALGLYAPDNITITEYEGTAARYWPVAQDGVTTDMILDRLGVEDGFYDEEYVSEYLDGRLNADLYYYGKKDTSRSPYGDGTCQEDGVVMPVDQLLGEASLISIGLGMSDVMNRARSLAMDNYTEIADVAKEMIYRIYEGYNNWLAQYPMLLDYLKENSDATVVLIGALNPLYGMTATENFEIPVGSIGSLLTDMMNRQLMEWADEYDYIFLDVSNVETGTTDRDGTLSIAEFIGSESRDQGIATHPTKTGYTQIARMLINALEENEKTVKTNVNNIVVDLGRLTSVDYVAVNGNKLKASKYSLKDSMLTIPEKTHLATRLTVAFKASDGSIAYTEYRLSYDHGYSAYRIYTTNSLLGGLQKLDPSSLLTLDSVFAIFKK